LEQISPFKEERSTFRKEGLVSGQIENRLIKLDLPEIRVDRGIQNQIAGDTVFEIKSGILPEAAAVRIAQAPRFDLIAGD
jgi:hypothetical protein